MLQNYFRNRFLVPVANRSVSGLSSVLFCHLHSSLALLTEQFSHKKTLKETFERTITAEDVEMFSKITGDHNTIHKPSLQRPAVVHGALLNGIVSGVIGTKLPGHGTIVISQTLRFPTPCHVGDTVVVTVEIEALRKIIPCKYNIINKHNNGVVMEGEAKLIVKNPVAVVE